MIKSWLESSIVYEFSQFLFYRNGMQREYVATYAAARRGERILDIGCGVGALARHFPDVVYHGFDSNDAYVERANRKYGRRAQFTRGVIGEDVAVDEGVYDLVMANGILHHLDDREALHLLELASTALKPGGRFVTRDGCFEQGQSRLVRLLLENDRGKYVRTREGYKRLIDRVFSNSTATIRRDMLRLPYSLIIFQCRK